VKEKAAIIQAVAAKISASELMVRFLTLLARKARFSRLAEIREAFSTAKLAAKGSVAGKLVAADQMKQEDVAGLAAAFSKKLGKNVEFRVSTDPSLLAGMKVTVSGVTYDGTLRSQLQRLRDKLVQGFTV
jgi:F-type H+-transporting ATPase subunit delta